jgi:putative hydrolase of the HAD superfamily
VATLTDGKAAVVFDFYGTLTRLGRNEVWNDHAAQLAALLGVSTDALMQALDQSYPERFTGALGGLRETLAALAGRLGVQLSSEQLDEAVALRRSVQETMFTLRPEAVPAISELRNRGLRIGLVSDCTSELPDAWPRLPVAPLIDAPVFSCVERTRKPDPRLFLTVAERLQVDPADCVYVGDGGGRELTGSSGVGMHAILLAGPDWHGQRVYEREDAWTGPRISSLTDLLG